MRLFILMVLLTVIPLVTESAQQTWTSGGSDSAWTNPQNWSITAPTSGVDSLAFGSGAKLVTTNDYPAGSQFNGITFNPGAAAFTLTGNPITLAGDISNNSSSAQAVSFGLILNSNCTFAGGTAGLVIGNISNSAVAGGQTNVLTGNGTLNLPMTSTGGGELEIRMNDGAGAWTIAGNVPSVVTNKGRIVVASGTLNYGTGSDSPTCTVTSVTSPSLGIGVTAAPCTFNMKSGSLAIGGASEGLTMGNAGGLMTLNVTGGTLTVTSGEFNFANNGGLTIITVNGGSLAANGLFRNTRGTGVVTVTSGSFSVGSLNLGGAYAAGQSSTLNLDGGTLTAGAMTDGGGGQAHAVTCNFNGGILKFSNSSTYGTNSTTFYVKNGGALIDAGASSVTFNQPFLRFPGSTGGLIKIGVGTLTLGATNFYTGPTVINDGTLSISGPGTLGDQNGGLLLNGTNAGLNINGLTVSNATVTLANGSIRNGTLYAGSFLASNGTLFASLAGPADLVKLGPGTLTILSTNNYAGQTIVSNGTLGFYQSLQPALGSIVWLDAAQTNMLAVNSDGSGGIPAPNGTVGRWTSRSGSVYASSGSGPVLVTNVLNGLPVLRFSGGNMAFGSPVAAQESTVFTVYRKTAAGGGWQNPLNSSANWMHMMKDNGVLTGGSERVFERGGGGLNLNSGVSANEWHVQTAQMKSGDYRLWVDGTPTGPTNATLTFDPFVSIGNISGDFAEVIIYGSMTDSERQQTHDYLSYKWFNTGSSSSPTNLLPVNTAMRLYGSGRVDLTSTTQTVAWLYFNGKMQPHGTHGSSGSSAQRKNDSFFAGSGILNVLNGPDDFGTVLKIR